MRLLELSLDEPAENLALDEALLEEADRGGEPREVLRLWESPQQMVVVGRSSRVDAEVHRAECRLQGIPVLRRSSGGATIVAGPGCLMYAVVLSYELRPALRMLDRAHRFVLGAIVEELAKLAPGIECCGTSDLALAGKKVSGNSMRCKRTHLLYHGTLLYDFPLPSVGAYLAMPPRQPEYRNKRDHDEFVANLPLGADEIRRALIAAWNIEGRLEAWPRQTTARLVQERYSRQEWNNRW